MEILQLKYFCSAAESENFSVTAAKFRVPPSSISQSIKRLETEIGAGLFDRSANRIKLNDRGREFYGKVNTALQLIQSASQQAASATHPDIIRICLKVNRRIATAAIEKFRIENPDTDIIVRHSSSDKSDFDFIISDGDFPEQGFTATDILFEQVMLAVRKDHPLASKEEIDWQLLKDEPLISMNTESSMYSLAMRAFAEKGLTPHIAIQSDDPFYIRRAVELGLAAAIVPSLSWRGQFSDDIVFKPIPNIKRVTCLYQNNNTPVSKNIERFAAMITEEFRKEAQLFKAE
ncbi:MAG: LysR family transcriptional regulator [Clostridia bacterium]|nr:LysR family transcriptional regulator [Clostridia bacterium]